MKKIFGLILMLLSFNAVAEGDKSLQDIQFKDIPVSFGDCLQFLVEVGGFARCGAEDDAPAIVLEEANVLQVVDFAVNRHENAEIIGVHIRIQFYCAIPSG